MTGTEVATIEHLDFHAPIKCESVRRECSNEATLLGVNTCPMCHKPPVYRPACQSCWENRRRHGLSQCKVCLGVAPAEVFWTARPL